MRELGNFVEMFKDRMKMHRVVYKHKSDLSYGEDRVYDIAFQDICCHWIDGG